MKIGDLRTIKRGILTLVLIGLSLAYIQLIAVEQWRKFCDSRVRLSRYMYFQEGSAASQAQKQTTPGMKLTYIDYNDTFLSYNGEEDTVDENEEFVDVIDADDNSADDTYREATELNGNVSVPRTRNNTATRRNKLATIELKRFIDNDTDFRTKPLMILFSSWEYSAEKERVDNVLLRMWNIWPSIRALVMTKDKKVQEESRKVGWYAKTITHVDRNCYGPPVLATMFTDIFKTHEAFFYGYSNADVIFGDELHKTMEFLYYYFHPWKTKPILVVGRRHNVDFIKYANFSLNKPDDVKKMTSRGKLVIRSTDYFFTNRHFPWGQAPRVSIGRPYVVRAIIGWALKKGFYVIDATHTIESVHLTTQDGVFASWHKKGVMCNEGVLAALHSSVLTSIGHCECARLETFHGVNNDIKLRHRPQSRKYCHK